MRGRFGSGSVVPVMSVVPPVAMVVSAEIPADIPTEPEPEPPDTVAVAVTVTGGLLGLLGLLGLEVGVEAREGCLRLRGDEDGWGGGR